VAARKKGKGGRRTNGKVEKKTGDEESSGKETKPGQKRQW